MMVASVWRAVVVAARSAAMCDRDRERASSAQPFVDGARSGWYAIGVPETISAGRIPGATACGAKGRAIAVGSALALALAIASTAHAQGTPVDPYGRPAGSGDSKPAPVDPYGGTAKPAAPVDPYARPSARPQPQPTPQPAPAPAPVDPYGTAAAAAANAGSWSGDAEIDAYVATALFERGKLMYARGDYQTAKTLLLESVERGGDSVTSRDAKALLAGVNGKLGLPADHGLARPAASGAGEGNGGAVGGPVDPYAPGGSGDLGAAGGSVGLGASATGDGSGDGAGQGPTDDGGSVRTARQTLLGSSTALGFTLGMGLAGPEDDDGNFNGGSLVVGALGAAGGAALAYYGTRNRQVRLGDANAIASAGLWGATLFGFFADVTTGIDNTTANDVFGGAAIGGLLGTGTGVLLAQRYDPSAGDVALINSFGIYGATGGLLLATAIDAAEDEGYTLNVVLGGALGLGFGTYMAGRHEFSRSRMGKVDLFALAGAAVPWVLVYPLVADEASASDTQLVGLLSTFTLGGGAILGFYLTRDRGGKDPASGASDAPPALLGRSASGQWQAGVPLLGPASLRSLDGGQGPRGIAVSVLSARF